MPLDPKLPTWNPDGWRALEYSQRPPYDDPSALARSERKLAEFPPLVTSWEVERLRTLLSEAQQGKRFVLQGGDCAEMLTECSSEVIANKLKILLQMSMVLVHGLKRPVVRVGRFAGQYAKPRTSPTETRSIDGRELTLPSYFGDLVNRAAFDADSRRANPELLVQGYLHAALTLNFIRALVDGGFADLHHPERWDLSFVQQAALTPERRTEYEDIASRLADGLRLMEALGEAQIEELARVEFFTSHEGLNLHYERAQTRTVPRRDGHYALSTHMPWIGDRTRELSGAHVDFYRGVQNPIGVKLGPSTEPGELRELALLLNPSDLPGKLAFITRLGAEKVEPCLPHLLEAVGDRRVLWICDPMHGNTRTSAGGVKTRSFEDIATDLMQSVKVHDKAGSILGGVHFELTGEDVTECTGGAAGLTDDGLTTNYTSSCDPRLNYQQSLELAFQLAGRLAR